MAPLFFYANPYLAVQPVAGTGTAGREKRAQERANISVLLHNQYTRDLRAAQQKMTPRLRSRRCEGIVITCQGRGGRSGPVAHIRYFLTMSEHILIPIQTEGFA